LLLWLPIEETGSRYAILFAFAIYAWWAFRWLITRTPDAKGFIIHNLLVGILASPTVTLIASSLMIFKTGLHLHSTPDFTFNQFYIVFLRTPLWSGIGLILSLGFGLFRFAQGHASLPPND
jgi:hypothetical protein